ncbi:Nif3-like dinuclear metal center hexameric protein [Exiguobacterium sp. RIT452]|uniref:Nif3-like dinuclear metal center hexameric protein n=1 Tax=Exiguobacterium sp. RIT452 TaxID=2315552 RepID=UPI000E726B6A|nr:Nif3-like dinuclear metal center hexameric protein [Exiguobacterium sp. RIT452]RJP01929.1 Nif3-like dinuclear metal center hexameric protein [Exiguobacterium sp. RIT452]
MANGQQIIEQFESFAPKKFAFEGDPIGLQIGTLNKDVKRVLVTLDVLESVVDEAIEKKIDLIIAHHPPIFSKLAQVNDQSAAGRIVMKCIKHEIAVYAAHTNLDVAEGGVNDLMADALGLTNTRVLVPSFENTVYKLAVFVPEEAVERVSDALGRAGAGHIGAYSDCQFHSTGTGQFKATTGAKPYVGQTGQIERVNEVRIETVVTELNHKQVIRAMKKVHPYEEVAYDLIRQEITAPPLGLGRIGSLEEAMPLKAFAEHVRTAFAVENLRFVGDENRLVRKIAVLGGDGNKYVSTAAFAGADVLVTGDLYFHVAHDAMALGLAVIDPGHHVESVMKQGVVNLLTERFTKQNIRDVELIVSTTNTNPFQFL